MVDKPRWSIEKVFEILKENEISKKLVDEYEKLGKKPEWKKELGYNLAGFAEEGRLALYDETKNVVSLPQWITNNVAALLVTHELHHVLNPLRSLPTFQDALDIELRAHHTEIDLYKKIKDKTPSICQDPEMDYFERKSRLRFEDRKKFEEEIIELANEDYKSRYNKLHEDEGDND